MNQRWSLLQQDESIRQVADMARQFSPEGYLNQHAVSQVAFELACQRNALLEALKDQKQLMVGYGSRLECDGAHVAATQVSDRIAMLAALITKVEGR